VHERSFLKSIISIDFFYFRAFLSKFWYIMHLIQLKWINSTCFMSSAKGGLLTRSVCEVWRSVSVPLLGAHSHMKQENKQHGLEKETRKCGICPMELWRRICKHQCSRMLSLALSPPVSANRALGPPGDPITTQGETLGEIKRRIANVPNTYKQLHQKDQGEL